MQRPDYLHAGDTVGLLALANKVDITQLQPAIGILKSWGLEVILGESLTSEYYQFAGTDHIRATDFQEMLDNQAIKAIFSARGGYGSSRLLDGINFQRFIESPKWIVGFSDITAVHCQVHQLGVESLHATMPKLFTQEGGTFALESLRRCLFGEEQPYEIALHALNRLGTATGQLIGGNLSLLAHVIGSKSEVDTTGKILFLEDVSEYLYNLDRMMLQLRRAGKLKNLAGLIVGHFSDLLDNETPFGKTANEIIAEHVSVHHFPVCYGFPCGHEPDNWAMPCGREITLKVSENEVSMNFFSN